MKRMFIAIIMLLLNSTVVFSQDGYCTCIYQIGEQNEKKFSVKSTRPVICASCEDRCQSLLDRVKKNQNTDQVTMIEEKCP